MRLDNKIEDCFEIVLITYNRSAFLAATLQMLEQSPFRHCHITVLDNCSPDDTGEVVDTFLRIMPNLTYIRNRINIGGNPNYLKAIELSASEYTWILCDDDILDFSDCDDVIAAVISGEFDLVEVGATDPGVWPRGTATSVRKMIELGLDYHFRLSFFPAYIFRTSLFDSDCFNWGYKHIDYLYPQFEFLNKSLRENFTIYLANHKIVNRNESSDHSFLPLKWYASWIACCRTISDDGVRYQAIEHSTVDRGFYKSLGFWTILEKKLGEGGFWVLVIKIFLAMNLKQRMKYLLVFPLALLPLPLSFWVWVRKSVYKIMKVHESDVPSLHFVKRG